MSTPVKIGLAIITVPVVIAAVLTYFIQTQVTPEKVRAALLPLIEKSLQRQVNLGEITIGLFTGISVADVEVLEKEGEKKFFSADSIALDYQLWPLLTGKLVIDRALLEHPEIVIVRHQNGHFNFSDLLPQKATENDISTSEGNTPISFFKLLIKEVNIKDGKLRYVDKLENTRSPYRYTLNQLNLTAQQITLSESFPVDISAEINNTHIDISGYYDFSRHVGDLALQMTPLDLVPFAPYLRHAIPGKIESGKLALNLDIDIKPNSLSSKGNITCTDTDLVLNQFPTTEIKSTTIEIGYALDFIFDKQLLQFSTLMLSFNDIKLGAEGRIDLSMTEPLLAFSLLFDQFDIREAIQTLPLDLPRKYEKYSFAGMISGRIDLAGKLKSGAKLVKSAQLSLSDVQANAKNMRASASGDITYSNNILHSENLLLQYGDQEAQLQLNANIEDLLIQGDFSLTAKTLNLNKILPERVEKGNHISGFSEERQYSHQTDEIGPFDLPLAMTGTMAVEHLIYKKLNIDKISANLVLKENHLTLNHLSGQIDRGNLQGSAMVNLGVKGLSYQGEFKLNQPSVSPLIAGLFPTVKQTISGQLQWHNNFSGRGTSKTNLLQNLQVTGDFSLLRGKIKGSPLTTQLALFLNSEDLKMVSFNSLTGQYNFHNGVTRLSGFLDSSKIKLTPTGTVALGGNLRLKLDTRLAPEIMNRLGITDQLKIALSDPNGWGTLPLKIAGTLHQPEIGFDLESLQQMALQKGEEKAAIPMKKLLENTLDKLFGN